MAGKQIRAYFDFKAFKNEKIKVKFALSPVSTDGALANMRAEIPHWDFERTKRDGQAAWNRELARIAVTTDSRDDMVNFYTSMYHAMLAPTVYMDTDGKYKGIDQNVHQALQNKGISFTNYTTFSLWDTYRALHPLLNIVQPARDRDMIRSMMAHFDQSPEQMLPVWSHYANENWCMIGYHSVSVIADAIEYYIKLGYVPADKNSSSVSKTLEYSYDDWAIAQAAKKLGRTAVYDEFVKRSGNWKNVFDPSTGFTRPKLANGNFLKEFDPLKTEGQGFIEGNAWNYSLYVPHDPAKMIEMMGGKQKFTSHLDELFTMDLPDTFFAETEDITREGIVGGYIHGNEPSHHVAYLYDWTDEPWKTQERVRMILKHQYGPTPDGLGGNDDCGQMSAWYIFSALGFYPVAPASGTYMLGSPAIRTATLRLENGRQLTIEARGQGDKNVYVTKVELNGRPLDRRYLTYADLSGGGKIIFHMSSERPPA